MADYSKFNSFCLFQFKAQWVSNHSDVTPKDFYRDVVYGLEDVVLTVLFNLIKPIKGDKNPKVNKHIFRDSESHIPVGQKQNRYLG